MSMRIAFAAACVLILVIILQATNAYRNTAPVIETKLGYEIVCIDGVAYLQKDAYSEAALSVKFNTDGTVATCNEGIE